VRLDVAALDARAILELATQCVDGIAKRDVEVLAIAPPVVTDAERASRDLRHEVDRVRAATLVAMRGIDDDATAHQLGMEPVEPLDALADRGFDGG
jgi:short-subunit dehydrogenase involved in D-alanine esterification of teichoic acids